MAANAPARPQTGPARRSVFSSLDVSQCTTAHRGLLLDKFVEDQGEKENNARQRLISEVCSRSWSAQNDPLYAAALQRWRKVWAVPGAVTVEAETAAPLAIGHGAKGVIDGGVRLHRTYGLPLIPGSSVRGALSAFADQMLGQQNPELWAAGSRPGDPAPQPQGKFHRMLFGDTSLAGRLAFEDAWWVPGPRPPLRHDVLTPHHQAYYTGTPRQEPAETDDPVPVTIPLVPPGSKFLFVVTWRSRPGDSPAEAQKWLDLMKFLLTQMLDQQGLGAKRSQGYGRMQVQTGAAAGGGPSLALQDWTNQLNGYKTRLPQFLQQIDSLKKKLDELEQKGEADVRTPLIALLKEAKSWQTKNFDKTAATRPWMLEWVEG